MVEVLTWRGLATYYVLFFIHLESRRVSLAGLTKHPTSEWMLQMRLMPREVPAFSVDDSICFMTAIRSSALPFWMSSDQVRYGRWPFRPRIRI